MHRTNIVYKVLEEQCRPVLGVMCRRQGSMQAWQLQEHGGLDKFQRSTVARSHVMKPEDVLVEVHAASVNPIDLAMLGGYGSQTLPLVQKLSGLDWSRPHFPLTLGRDFSGVVVGVGRGAAKRYKSGDQVWGVVSPLLTTRGSHASHLLTPAHCLSHRPVSLSHVEAASVPYVLCTVVSALSVTGCLSPRSLRDKRVLLVGGSGGVGTFATQMFTMQGAHVTAVCSADSADLMTSLGATATMDYKTEGMLSELRGGEPFDLILDCVTKDDKNLQQWMELLYPWKQAHYIKLSSPFLQNSDQLGFLPGMVASAADVISKSLKYRKEDKHYRWAFFTPRPNELRSFAQDFDKGVMRPVIDSVFPFTSVPEAFERLQAGHIRGKVVIQVKE